MSFKRVAVIRGGDGEEYPFSMETGISVLDALRALEYPVKDIVITKKGDWLDNGLTKQPEQALEAVDVVFVAVQGELANSGEVQKILNRLQLPFTGSGSLSSKIARNKPLAKDMLRKMGVKMPKHRVVRREQLSKIDLIVEQLNKALGEELFVKPARSGSSIGASYAPNAESLQKTLRELLQAHEEVIVEEFIRGREATVAVVDAFRNQPVYVLPAVEIVPPAGEPLYSHEHKVENTASQVAPGRFSYGEKTQLEKLARLIHEELNCKQYSRSDFIIRNGDVYFLEVNTLPSVTEQAPLYAGMHSIGVSYRDFISFLIETAKR